MIKFLCWLKVNSFLCIHKIVIINKETYENNNIEAIVDGNNKVWFNEKHIEEKLGHKNLPAITNKYDQMYKKRRHEQPNRNIYVVI